LDKIQKTKKTSLPKAKSVAKSKKTTVINRKEAPVSKKALPNKKIVSPVRLNKIGAKKMDDSKLPQTKLATDILEEDLGKTKEDTVNNAGTGINASPDFRNTLAKTTVKNYSLWATAAGFIPVSFLDTATISGVQLKMIYDLCDIYKVPFKKEAALAIITALTGGGVTTFAASKLLDLGIKEIPYVGKILSVATQPAISYGTTYGLGKIFIQHFEDSGTLLNIDVSDAKVNFKKHYENAKSDYFKQMNKAKSWFKKEDKVIDAEVKEVVA
jgi:uncharacterized protein (DUF697 family)